MIKLYRSAPLPLQLLAWGCVVFTTGTSFLWPMTTTYVHQVMDRPLTVAALVLFLHQLASLGGNLIGGYVFDRWGAGRPLTAVVLTIIALLGGLGWNTDGFTLYVVLFVLLGLFSGILFPTLNALASKLWPEGGRDSLNLVYVAQNLGVAIGSGLGGWIASHSFRWSFYGNGITYVLFLLLLLAIGRATAHPRAQREAADASETVERNVATPDHPPRRTAPGMVWLILLAVVPLWMAYGQWATTVPIYMQSLGISLSSYSLLWTLNGGLIVLGQPLVTALNRRVTRTLNSQLIVGGIIFLASFVMVATAGSFAAFAAAMAVLTIAEMIAWPALPTIIHQLSPRGREGTYQGIYSGAVTLGRMLGPLLGSWLYERTQPELTYLTMAGMCAAATLLFFLFHKMQSKAHPTSSPTAHTSA